MFVRPVGRCVGEARVPVGRPRVGGGCDRWWDSVGGGGPAYRDVFRVFFFCEEDHCHRFGGLFTVVLGGNHGSSYEFDFVFFEGVGREVFVGSVVAESYVFLHRFARRVLVIKDYVFEEGLLSHRYACSSGFQVVLR